MKLSTEDLQRGAVKPTSITYDKDKATLHTIEPSDIYQPQVAEYAKVHGVMITKNLKEALELRLSGQFCLSPREADIAARGRIEIGSDFFRTAFLHKGMMLMATEGTPGMEVTGWNLRTTYNRGLEWFKTKRANDTPEKVASGDNKLDSIRIQLAEMFLPLWESEISGGIHVELTKPEWQTWKQYTEACQKKLFVL